jgi:hypothetical protein
VITIFAILVHIAQRFNKIWENMSISNYDDNTISVRKNLKNLTNLVSMLNNEKVFGPNIDQYSKEQFEEFSTILEMIETTLRKIKETIQLKPKELIDCKRTDKEENRAKPLSSKKFYSLNR